MFKTIHECQLKLVGASASVAELSNEDVFFTDDMMPVRAARASFGKQDKTGENPEGDVKLMKFLAEHGHLTPFEYQHATFLIECPMFIRSQIHRHRTFSYNEISRRYTSENLEFWIPDSFRGQAKSNKQASSDEVVTEWIMLTANESIPTGEHPSESYKRSAESALNYYLSLLASGVSREQARAVLPQSLLTRFYMGGNLRNWSHFVTLRKDAHAQYEVRVIAERISEHLSALWPNSWAALQS